MPTFVIEDHTLVWHIYQICYPLEINLLLLLLLLVVVVLRLYFKNDKE